MDSPEQLLLSEGVCRQLGIVSYHPSLGIEPVKEMQQQQQVVKVRLVGAVRVLPLSSSVVQLAVERGEQLDRPVPTQDFTGAGLRFCETLVSRMDGLAQVVVYWIHAVPE